ncbi:MAG: HisA/HisF-related TIM barrel protein [Gemmatimonadaceae bacterium]
MIAIPALDLRDGACVQLVGGDYSAERVRLPNPIAVLQTWESCGFTRAHIVDLDAATERGSNAAVVRDLLGATSLEIQVGGGVRSDESVNAILAAGARYALLGTRAVEDPLWLDAIAQQHPGGIIVAVDVKEDVVVCRGWSRSIARALNDIIADLNALPLAGVLVTAVHVEGQMRGPDLSLTARVAAACKWPVLIAGGVASRRDLNALAERGAAGAIIGMALYSGALDPRAIAKEFAA